MTIQGQPHFKGSKCRSVNWWIFFPPHSQTNNKNIHYNIYKCEMQCHFFYIFILTWQCWFHTHLKERMHQNLSIMHCINYWYLNFNRCSSEQHAAIENLRERRRFWNWNSLTILSKQHTSCIKSLPNEMCTF